MPRILIILCELNEITRITLYWYLMKSFYSRKKAHFLEVLGGRKIEMLNQLNVLDEKLMIHSFYITLTYKFTDSSWKFDYEWSDHAFLQWLPVLLFSSTIFESKGYIWSQQRLLSVHVLQNKNLFRFTLLMTFRYEQEGTLLRNKRSPIIFIQPFFAFTFNIHENWTLINQSGNLLFLVTWTETTEQNVVVVVFFLCVTTVTTNKNDILINLFPANFPINIPVVYTHIYNDTHQRK